MEPAPSLPALYFQEMVPYVAYVRGLTEEKMVFIGQPGPSGWIWDSTDIERTIDSQDKSFDFVMDD